MSEGILNKEEYNIFIDGLSKHLESKERYCYDTVKFALECWPKSRLSKMTTDDYKDFITFFIMWLGDADKRMNHIQDYDLKGNENEE